MEETGNKNYQNEEFDYSESLKIDREGSKQFKTITEERPWLKYYPEEVINAKLPEDTIYGYIKNKNANELDRIAIEYFGNKLTYSELLGKIEECTRALVAMGVKKGDIVTICMPTTPETVYMFYALSKIGAISNMIDPRKSAKEIEEYANEVNSKIFLGIDVAGEKLRNLKQNTSVENIIIATPYESFKNPLKKLLKLKDKLKAKISSKTKRFIDTKECMNWDEFIKLGNSVSNVEEVKYEKDMPVTIVHTGGTTGKPKGVVLSNDNINCGAFQCEISGLDFKDRGTWLNIMPPFIAYGIGNGLHLPLSMGMKVILIPKFDPTKYDKILLKYKPNYMAGVPSHYGYLLESKKLKGVDLSFIKAAIVGGDKMDYTLEKEVNAFLKDHGCSSGIIKGYGMSETNAANCIEKDGKRIGSVGIPLPHTNIGIFDPNTKEELSYNQDGEVWISGPNVMLGYYNNDSEEKKILHTDKKGTRWICSGDLGCFDNEGHLYVKDRYKDLIARPDGFKWYPSKVEQLILSHEDVSECIVIGCRDFSARQGEIVKVFIKLKDSCKDQNTILNEIKLICEITLAEYELPYDYEIIDNIPLTSVGKIDRLSLKEAEEKKLKGEKHTKNLTK